MPEFRNRCAERGVIDPRCRTLVSRDPSGETWKSSHLGIRIVLVRDSNATMCIRESYRPGMQNLVVILELCFF